MPNVVVVNKKMAAEKTTFLSNSVHVCVFVVQGLNRTIKNITIKYNSIFCTNGK
jgi:hypothetical protein